MRKGGHINSVKILRDDQLPFLELKIGAAGLYSTRSHSHRELSIGFIDTGYSQVFCNQLDFFMKPGSVIFIPPECVHLCEPENSEIYRFKMLYIDSEWFRSIFGMDPVKMVPIATVLKERDLGTTRSFFEAFTAHEEILKKESDCIYFIGHLMFDVFRIREKDPSIGAVSGRVETAKQFLENNFSNAIALSELESVSGLSKFSLLRKFKNEVKLTPHAYLINIRINHARTLLKEQDNIAAIAAECGFYDQSHLSKTFRHYFGMTPHDYRNQKCLGHL